MENIAEKVRLLLNLSKSDNPHEAASAANKAQELLHKYNLSMFDVDQAVKDSNKDIQYEKSIIPGFVGWRISLLNSIALTNGAYVVKLSDGKASLIAQPHSKEIVLHLYEYLSREIERLAEYNFLRADTSVHGKAWKHSFRMGALGILDQRMKEKNQELKKESIQSTAMIIISDKALNSAVTNFYPRLRTAGRTSGASDRTAYRQGIEAGRNMSLNNVVGAGSSRRMIS